jgi:probable biosynthetic protein (TIGR04099 family)
MTVAILDFPSQTPTTRDLMERALEPHLLIGMPHMTPRGLSETWLMKELGHRHWLMLARDRNMDNADFRTVGGSEAYAAICATSLRNARLDRVSANDVLTIRTTLAAISRTQTSSTHRLLVGATPIAEVEILSTFVHRLTEGDNHSIARVQLPGTFPAKYVPNSLAKMAAEMRASRHGPGTLASDQKDVRRFSFRTSLSQEFNGAGLFYFAQFQAVMERAHEQLFPAEATRSQISHRDVFFFGNVQKNEILTVQIREAMPDDMFACCRIFRADGKAIAYSKIRRDSF